MTLPPEIDYHVQPTVGTVTVQRSADRVLITIGPSVRRILPALTSSLVLMVFAGGLFVLFAWSTSRAHSFTWGVALFPLIFFGIAVLNALINACTLFFPVTYEVTPDQFIGRWRKLTEAQSFVWSRQAILGVDVGKRRINKNITKTRGLFVQHRDIGEVLIFKSSRGELLFIAETLRSAMGLQNVESPALTTPAPARCRYRRVAWRDGVHIFILPAREKTVAGILLIVCGFAGAYPMYWLGAHEYVSDGGPTVARVFLAIVIALLLWAAMLGGARRVRKKVAIAVDSKKMFIMETSLLNPMQVQFRYDQLRALIVAPLPENPGQAALHIVPQQGAPLVLLNGEPTVHLHWLVEIVGAVSPAAKGLVSGC